MLTLEGMFNQKMSTIHNNFGRFSMEEIDRKPNSDVSPVVAVPSPQVSKKSRKLLNPPKELVQAQNINPNKGPKALGK